MARDPFHTTTQTALSLILCGLLASCTYLSGRTDVLVSSTPAGAAVYLDGVDTGETTPVLLDIGDYVWFSGYLAGDHEVTVRKAGFEPETRALYHHSVHYTSKWIDGAVSEFLPVSVPLFWTTGDWFAPFGVKWQFAPHELHVKLYPLGEAPGYVRGSGTN